MLRSLLLASCFAAFALPAQADDLARKLAGVKFEKYADAPGYSEGPTWRNGDVFFCSGALLRVDDRKRVNKYLEIGPAGTILRADGHLIVADNKHRAILDVSPDGTVGVLADRHDMQALRGLNDLTADARGNIYWTDPEGSTPKTPVGRIYRLRPDGRVDQIGGGLMFPNGLDVDPASKFLYVIESQSKKILRYALPDDRDLLGKPEVFYDLGGSGGDGCAFDAAGNLWVADFHRPDTMTGRITVLNPEGKALAYLPVPAKVVSNIAFGGPNHDEIFCTTGDPPGVFHAKVGVKGFAGHSPKPMKPIRMVNVVPIKPHPEADTVRALFKPENMTERGYRPLIESLKDQALRKNISEVYPRFSDIVSLHSRDKKLLDEIRKLGGTASSEVDAPKWLREVAGDEALAVFGRFTEIILNERTDGHKEPVAKAERVTDAWLAKLAGQDRLRRLELSGTAITSAGLVHLKGLKKLELLNTCLTAVDDRGFEHLAGLTGMKRMVICASKITGSGFKHLGAFDRIESINLHSTPASDAGLEAIGKLKNLRRLEIVHTSVTDAGLKHLANLTELRQLHVASHDTGADGLAFLASLKELYELDVYEKTASNATCAHVAKLPKLRKLMLITGTFDDAGVKLLANMDTLEDVTLNSAGVTDASVETIATWKHLRKLNLGGTKITPAGKAKLAAAIPTAIIE